MVANQNHILIAAAARLDATENRGNLGDLCLAFGRLTKNRMPTQERKVGTGLDPPKLDDLGFALKLIAGIGPHRMRKDLYAIRAE